ncbi:hypothetical protein NDU88_003073 [Pleurodeles waltl]|uniref:Uncharacterized protein n=1 Tax=Pleurodeles waltl TaxID=8319 RepID=A0AAV7WN17_PLEWA|nr:hypothetical protein NDU88_003073 [Pleurodeles waltl]
MGILDGTGYVDRQLSTEAGREAKVAGVHVDEAEDDWDHSGWPECGCRQTSPFRQSLIEQRDRHVGHGCWAVCGHEGGLPSEGLTGDRVASYIMAADLYEVDHVEACRRPEAAVSGEGLLVMLRLPGCHIA